MLIALRILLPLMYLGIAVLICLCGWNYYMIPETIRIVSIGSFRIWLFSPGETFVYVMEEGIRAFEGSSWECVAMVALSAFIWLVLSLTTSRIFRLFANRKTTLHGSSKWATKNDLRSAGLLKKQGLVLGQTFDAVYRKVRIRKPKRKKGESRPDYKARLEKWDRKETEYRFEKPGDLITQSKNAHTLVVGSTRSGKGVSVLIPTTFQWPESLIILDPKAESWEISASCRARFSYTFQFRPEKPDESIHYNPLLAIRRGKQAIPDIQNLAYILIPNNEQSKEPFWDNEARKLFSAVCGYVIYCEPPEHKNFAQIASIFSNYQVLEDAVETEEDQGLLMVKRYLKYYVKRIQQYIRTGQYPEEIRDEWDKLEEEKAEAEKAARGYDRDSVPVSVEKRLNDISRRERELKKRSEGYLSDDDVATLREIEKDLVYFSECEDKQLSSTLSTMTSHFNVISDPNVQAITDRSDFTMEDFVHGIVDEKGNRAPLSLYLCVSLSSIQRLVPLIKIFYEQAITLLTRDLDSKRPYRLLLIFDEFRQLGKMDIVEKALALSAGYGVLCAVAIQSYDQLKVLYQSESIFTDNFAYQVILRVNDDSTCQKIERILGQATKQHKSTGYSGNVDLISKPNANISVSEVGRSLMTAEEIRTMDDNECIIISSGEHPYKAKKIRYYMDPRFTRLYKDKDGRTLPPPDINDNYPHPEAIHDGVNEGVDNEGWHALKGAAKLHDGDYTAEVESGKDEEKRKDAGDPIIGRSDDYINDSTDDPDEDAAEEAAIDSLGDASHLAEYDIDDIAGWFMDSPEGDR